MNTPPEVGELIQGDAFRDAIHIAVAPVIAGERLDPGMRVGKWANGEFGECEDSRDHIGIVDPFLTHSVLPGDRFWLFMYPNTVTGLRHAWSHPAFALKAPLGKGKDNG